ncbi:MAG: hypothetical protein A4E67_00115 [Syntrophaceae bacterium PtaB.Bin038]|nr:MAG: hypothetical protein A4E67_00115 [Syntrophaceae bacterium PtaB.Bin038]
MTMTMARRSSTKPVSMRSAPSVSQRQSVTENTRSAGPESISASRARAAASARPTAPTATAATPFSRHRAPRRPLARAPRAGRAGRIQIDSDSMALTLSGC